MLLPCTLKRKFGEEYSSVYYITIRVLLFYDDAKKRKKGQEEIILPHTLEIKFGEEYSSSVYYIIVVVYTTSLYVYYYSMTMQNKSCKIIGNKLNIL